MTARRALVALALAAALTAAAAGCRRPRHGGLFARPPAAPTQSAVAAPDRTVDAAAVPAVAPTTAARLRIDVPRPDARLTSPVQVSGVVQRRADQLYVAQVVVASVPVAQRGNQRLVVGDDGSFAVAVPYTLERAAEGTVEIVAVDPVSGTVAESVSVPVWLAAAP